MNVKLICVRVIRFMQTPSVIVVTLSKPKIEAADSSGPGVLDLAARMPTILPIECQVRAVKHAALRPLKSLLLALCPAGDAESCIVVRDFGAHPRR